MCLKVEKTSTTDVRKRIMRDNVLEFYWARVQSLVFSFSLYEKAVKS